MMEEKEPTQEGPTQADLLELDIDIRMSGLWEQAMLIDEWDEVKVACFMRAAYGKGYTDAHSERQQGKLFNDNGYALPRKGTL